MSADALPADSSPYRNCDLHRNCGLCRNCGATAWDAYCPSCGQETDIRLPSVRQFMHEATRRLIALDGRL